MNAVSTARQAARHWFAEAEVRPLGDGHIHETYLVTSPQGRYVLQRLNEHVFRQIDLLARQTDIVLDALAGRLPYALPELVPASQGSVITFAAAKWRMWRYIEGATVDPPTETTQIRAAGEAFARFQSGLAKIPAETLRPTIEGFLDLSFYLDAYREVEHQAEEDWRQRIDKVAHLGGCFDTGNANIHGDCKVNNLLFDPNGGGVKTILDLDTVMWAPRALDYGDLVRSVCVSRGRVDPEFFTSAYLGFRDGGVRLSTTEAVQAPACLAYMLTLRFLTDHLNGDKYFRVSAPGDNLRRAEAQYALLQEMLKLHDPLTREFAGISRSG